MNLNKMRGNLPRRLMRTMRANMCCNGTCGIRSSFPGKRIMRSNRNTGSIIPGRTASRRRVLPGRFVIVRKSGSHIDCLFVSNNNIHGRYAPGLHKILHIYKWNRSPVRLCTPSGYAIIRLIFYTFFTGQLCPFAK